MQSTINIIVLRGGPSAERSVSLASGGAVADACRRLGYSVTESDIGPSDLERLDEKVDVVFPVLHGPFGEDGHLQAILEQRGISYVGSGPAASGLAMDKSACKLKWQEAGLPTAPWITVDSSKPLRGLPQQLSLPVVVKPLSEGSSIGVSICETIEGLQAEVTKAVETYGQVMIEQRLAGPELTVGILGDSALPIIQVQPAKGFYDFEAKYSRNDTAYRFDPEIDQAAYGFIQELALRAFRVLGCRDFGRVDVIVDEKDGPQLLEINTIPGFTAHSLLPKAAAQTGIGFDQLVERLVQMALGRKIPSKRSMP
jgi:D-alanine-D-alanine ligase